MSLLYGRLTYEEPVNPGETALGGEIRLGAFTYFNYGCEVGDSEIGRYCSIGQRVIIAPGVHPVRYLTTHPIASDPSGISAGMVGVEAYRAIAKTEQTIASDARAGKAVIGNDVWIGARAIVMRGTVIGDGAVIAAAAVVTSAVRPYEIVAGVPARHVGWRFDEPMRERLHGLQWWQYDLSVLDQRDYSDVPAMATQLEGLIEAGRLPRFSPPLQTRLAS